MAKSAHKAGQILASPASGSTPQGFVGRATTKIGGSLIDTVLSHVWSAVIITPVLGYLALWQTNVVPSPEGIADLISQPERPPPVTPRSVGIAEVKALGDGPSGELSRAIQLRVTGLLLPMPDHFGGVSVQYKLGPVRSGSGANSATSVRWALAAKGTEWRTCPEIPVSFTSQRALAEQIARQINNSLTASETGGVLQCS